MTPLYLKQVALRQFRSFATLDVELPPEPGVLIVHGSNGLGKSSLFDALEWALSDRIDHFRDANGVNKPGTYLCRWREGEPGPTSTTMVFSDESTIERSLLSAKSTTSQLSGNVPDITAFLRAPAWQQRISELQRYLLLTHFLGQSTLSRLTYRKSSERFDILKEAAQSTAIEAIANALHGQGNTTVVRAYARQIEALERDAKSLGDLMEQESALWVEARVSGALDDAAAQAEARRIGAQLIQAEFEGQGFGASPGDLDEPSIEGLQATIDRNERDCFSAEAQTEEARRLHSELQRVLTDLAEVAASRATTQKRIDVLGDQLVQAQKLQSDRRTDVTTHQQRVAGTSTVLSRLRALRDARTLVARLDTEHREAGVAEAAADQAKKVAESGVTIAERRRQISQRINDEIDQCGEEMDRLRDIAATVDQATACEARIGEKSFALAGLEAGNPDIDAAVERSKEMVATATDTVDAQTALVESLRDTVDTMSNAIASIATHLPSDACDCPLCATHFDSAAELRTRVSTAAERLAPALFAQEEKLKSLSAALGARNSELQQLQVSQAAILSARADLNVEREQRVRLVSRLDGGATETPIDLAATRARVAETIAAIGARRKRKQRWQTHPALDGQTSSADYSRAIRERDAAQRRLDAATRAATDLAASLERARLDEASANSATGTLSDIDPNDLSRMIQEAEAELLGHEEAFAAATRALTDADTAEGALEAERAGLRARLAEIDSRKHDLDETQRRVGDDWLGLKRFGPAPDLAAIQIIEGRIAASRLVAKEAAARLARLREGRLAWSRQVSHRTVLDQIRDQVDGPPNATRDEVLARAAALRAKDEADAEAVREVKEIAKAASADISAELEDFNSEYIKPLGFLMSRINQAILCDPRVGIDLHVKRKRIEQSAVKGGEVPKAVGEIDPVLVHSEGQMAALAVSMLCAASLTFPWSRWKALILDDPLQHNDSIHAAAFADLMGNLVSGEGYQVLLTTHDVAQAEFLQRKFRSRRIPCVTLSLLGLGKDGVEWSVQSSASVGARSASA
ncbi:AAA family ATPase [Methylobacterium sp. E-045]|uniref:AAA family ATPase n=1 Tax=Methylobacterium sp. E-045 TaxID=2836575 RepID=UPI001FB8FB4C|nr:AAA family ATPase [Methylobacterium sp. E-045]MCJ2130618.1 AAA family ATPase [Methylobacterium sp. E-045]